MHSEDAFGREEGAEGANQDAHGDAKECGRWVTAQEAAEILALQPRAVQRRAEIGKLRSKRDGRRLLVWIEEKPEAHDDANIAHDDAHQAAHDDAPLVEQLRSENAFLREQLRYGNAFLQEQLEARTSAEAEFRRLLAHAQEAQRSDRLRIEALQERLAITAGENAPEATERGDIVEAKTAHEAANVRPWWAWWKKGE